MWRVGDLHALRHSGSHTGSHISRFIFTALVLGPTGFILFRYDVCQNREECALYRLHISTSLMEQRNSVDTSLML